MKYCKNLNRVIIIKYYNNIGVPLSRLRYDDCKLKQFHIYDCHHLDQCKFDGYCLSKCKADEYIKPVTCNTKLMCLLTNKYKIQSDCKCEDTCSASKSEMYLYHEDECT